MAGEGFGGFALEQAKRWSAEAGGPARCESQEMWFSQHTIAMGHQGATRGAS